MNCQRLAPLALVAIAALAACAQVGPAAVQPARAGFPGFDTWRYPGDELLADWRRDSPYQWIGYYLPSPCHRSDSFQGKRELLARLGWGFAVLYVGQQTFDGEVPAELSETTLCSSVLLTAAQGEIDARDAIARAAADGFAPGTVIFLNVERMERVTPGMADYYQSWTRTLLADGRFSPGTYAHIANATALYTLAQNVYHDAGVERNAPFWIAGGSGFTLDSAPDAVGYSFAEIWQGVLDVQRTWGGRTLVVDENVATSRSPSTDAP